MRAIYRAKGRPSDNPLILHICDMEMLPQAGPGGPFGGGQAGAGILAGALTMVLPKTSQVPDAVSGGLDTVAIRFPGNLIARELIRRCGKPVAAPSAQSVPAVPQPHDGSTLY